MAMSRPTRRRGRSHARRRASIATLACAVLASVAVGASTPPAGAADPQIVMQTACDQAPASTGVNGVGEDGDESGIISGFIDDIAGSFDTKAADSITGWILDSIFGAKQDPTPAELAKINQQLAAQHEQLNQIQVQLAKMDQELADLKNAILTALDQDTLDVLKAQLNPSVAYICGRWSEFQDMAKLTATGTTQKIGAPLSETDRQLLRDIRLNMRVHLETLRRAVPGILAKAVTVAVERQPGFVRGVTREGVIYTEPTLRLIYDLLDSYAGMSALGLALIAEAEHIDLSTPTTPDPGNPQRLKTAITVVDTMVDAWKTNYGKDIGRIPKGTTFDLRSGLLWYTDELQVPVESVFHDTKLAFACYNATCKKPPGVVSVPNLPTYLQSLTVGSRSSWRPPTLAEVQALAAGVNLPAQAFELQRPTPDGSVTRGYWTATQPTSTTRAVVLWPSLAVQTVPNVVGGPEFERVLAVHVLAPRVGAEPDPVYVPAPEDPGAAAAPTSAPASPPASAVIAAPPLTG